jgi:hypothetical protein
VVDVDEVIVLEDGVVEEVKQFCYLSDVLNSDGGVERVVRAIVSSAWRKWREIAGLLVKKTVSLRNRRKLYDACIRLVLLYDAASWGLTQRVESVMNSCDRRILRYSQIHKFSSIVGKSKLKNVGVHGNNPRIKFPSSPFREKSTICISSNSTLFVISIVVIHNITYYERHGSWKINRNI